ncbi:MAG: helicase [Deltaproteobacteria bacterium RBG_16_71_12]|nr:MAG: helicase [Deltaproteobacteria bacterium RBG_16_71_12]
MGRVVAPPLALSWFAGTLELRGLEDDAGMPPGCAWDERDACHRAPACRYAELVLWARDRGLAFEDRARRYQELAHGARGLPPSRPFQAEALDAWRKARGRGVVVLPTGAGKTHVALRAIDDRRRSALVVAPTLDLVRQWHELLTASFGGTDGNGEVGVLGGGQHEIRPLTVTTYDSAWAHMEHLGARFGLVVFDEVHHLCAEAYAQAARLCLAPYRLGLTATPERADGREALLDELVGPVVYRKEIDELEGEWLAEYDVVRLEVVLSEADRAAYDAAHAEYRAFVQKSGVRLSSPQGWGELVKRAARSAEGRSALAAHRRQRALSFAAPQKLDELERLLERHRGARTLVFTDDNATAYAIARRFLVPVITHQTKVRERSALLKAFSDGALPVLATSRVLNEGIDVPEAQVAVIVSGTGSVREHVQRLGRVLRRREGKRAVLYELVTADTGEAFTSERRRDHVAYR